MLSTSRVLGLGWVAAVLAAGCSSDPAPSPPTPCDTDGKVETGEEACECDTVIETTRVCQGGGVGRMDARLDLRASLPMCSRRGVGLS